MFGNNAVPKGGFNAFKSPQRTQPSGDAAYAGGTPNLYENQRRSGGAGQAQPQQPPSTGTPYGAYAQPTFGSGFLEGGQGQHYPGRPLGFGARPPGFGRQPAQQPPASDAISPYAVTLPAPPPPQLGYPGFDPRTQAPSGQPLRPGNAQPIAQPPQVAPYRQPPSQPQYGTPPERRGGPRMADWRDADQDGVDDRDQDGPGMPAYGQPPQTGVRVSPGFDPRIHGYNPGMAAWRPVSGPQPALPQMPVRMPYAGGMDYEQGPPVVRPGLTLTPRPRRTGMAEYQPTRRR
jgi:hypothetical protein